MRFLVLQMLRMTILKLTNESRELDGADTTVVENYAQYASGGSKWQNGENIKFLHVLMYGCAYCWFRAGVPNMLIVARSDCK